MIVCQLSRDLEDSVSGRLYVLGNQDKSLNIPARSSELFEKFARDVQEGLPNFLSDEFKTRLDEIIQETRGVDLDNFMSGPVFKAVISGAFDAPLATHSESLKQETHKLIRSFITNFSKKLSSALPNLFGYVMEVVDAFLDDRITSTGNTLDIILKAEQSHVFTQNHYYMDTITRFRAAVDAYDSTCYSDDSDIHTLDIHTRESPEAGILKEFVETASLEFKSGSSNASQGLREMQVSLYAYSEVLRKRVFDVVPMVVRDALISNVCCNLTAKLMSHAAHHASQLEHAMSQDPETVRLREHKTRTLNSLKSALTDFMTLERC